MKKLYLDCGMGAAGDMLAAALLALFPNQQEILQELNAIGIPETRYVAEPAERCGVKGLHLRVEIAGEEETGQSTHHHHSHRTMAEIEEIFSALTLPDSVRAEALEVYHLLAEAEGAVHGVPAGEVHFHEVGTMDAIADITAVCYLVDRLQPDKIVSFPVATGSGIVRCAHGLLPVPAPATAYLLQGVPCFAGGYETELCTPTGAALLRHFATEFAPMPLLRPQAIGYGMGKKDLPQLNAVRAILGSTEEQQEEIFKLSCNLDDMTGEEIAFAAEQLFAAGALEVFTVPVGMKKSRPGVCLCVICKKEQRENLARVLFRHTTTLGVRQTAQKRYILARSVEQMQTPFGAVRKKVSGGYGTQKEKYEYEDLAKLAREQGKSLREVRAELTCQD